MTIATSSNPSSTKESTQPSQNSGLKPRRTLNRLAWALVGLVLAFLGQAAFNQDSLWDGLLLYGLAAIIFVRALAGHLYPNYKFSLPNPQLAGTLTKYSEEGLRARGQRKLDVDNQPSPFKTYHSETVIDLTRGLPFDANPFTGDPIDRFDESEPGSARLAQLSRTLFLTYGVTAAVHFPNGAVHALRAAPSAGMA